MDGAASRAHAARSAAPGAAPQARRRTACSPSCDGVQWLHHLSPHQSARPCRRRDRRRRVCDVPWREMKLNEMSATELSGRLSRREVTVLQVVEACLAEIQLRDRQIHAWATIDAEFVRRQARELDAGAVRGALHGLPIGVKDILDTVDLPSEYGSLIYAGHRPAWDAACVAAARSAGAVILGKTRTTEFATMHPTATVNPHDPRRTPGGSSSGSAAAVAAHMVPFAYGTQTVGSIIRPAAYCGVVGYKPSFGMLSRSGMKMACESLDTVGVIARTVEDAALLVAGSGMRSIDVPSVDKPRLGLCRTQNW